MGKTLRRARKGVFEPVEKHNTFEGTLKELTSEEATLVYKEKTREKEVKIERSNISKARLAIEF